MFRCHQPGGCLSLKPDTESIREYFFKTFDAQITFVIDGNARATELILHEGGTDVHADRIK